MKLLLERIRLSLQKRTKVAQIRKDFATWAARGYDFCRVPTVNRAPMWLNKELFTSSLGHIEETHHRVNLANQQP